MTEQKNFFNAMGLFSFMRKYIVHLTIVVLIASIVSVFISYQITPRFKSTVILFPTTSSSVSQTLITASQQKKDLLKFGEEEDVEQLIQMLQSNEIRNRIIEKYNLFDHYKVDKNSKYPNTAIYNKYSSNVKVSRTELMSVKIEVLDESPDMAMFIANDIVVLVDSAYSRIQRERAQKAFDLVEREFIEHKEKIQTMEDSLAALSKLGVIDVRSQTEMYSEQYAIALIGNKDTREIEAKLGLLAEYGSVHTRLKEQMLEELKRLSILESKYREAKIDLEQDLPNTYVVSPAERAEKKSKPVRMVIVAVSVISSFLLALILLIFFDNLKKSKKD